MATRRISILGFGLNPDNSGKAWLEPYIILATNDVWNVLIGRIDQDGANNAQLTTKAGFYGLFRVPGDYVTSAVIGIEWTSTITTGNVVWDFDYRAITGDDSESLDQAGTQEGVTVTDAAPGAANRRLEVTVNLTSANLAAGDIVEFFLANDGVDANDTLAGARLLFNAYFQYSDA